MNCKTEWKPMIIISGMFFVFYFLPIGWPRFDASVMEALTLAKWYAREHVILCLLPAFFIAGGVGSFLSSSSVMKYLGGKANKLVSYGVASVSGSILAVCSCTVLPLFAGIYRMGAGLGPAVAFLYSGPAINVLAIVLTANVLGMELGIARAMGAVFLSIIIGLVMQILFRKEQIQRIQAVDLPEEKPNRPLWQNAVFFFLMVAILVFANWGKTDANSGVWAFLYQNKWYLTILVSLLFFLVLYLWFQFALWKSMVIIFITGLLIFYFGHSPQIPFAGAILVFSIFVGTSGGQMSEWFRESWGFTRQILPLLLFGVLLAGFFLGSSGAEGIVPKKWISDAVGGNSIGANLFASMAGALMYFATLTEIPILWGLMEAGMGKGPALALLLAGPALSLPSMLVIHTVMGLKKTVVYISLVVLMSASSGFIFGNFF